MPADIFSRPEIEKRSALKRRKPGCYSHTGFHKKGGDLLSHNCSTIGAEGLNFSVRNGKRWNTLALTTYIFSYQSIINKYFLYYSMTLEEVRFRFNTQVLCSFYKKKEAFG